MGRQGHLSRYHEQHGSPAKGHKFGQNPLRKIVSILIHSDNIFIPDWVKMECGHEGYATPNARRARCKKCGAEKKRSQNPE